MILRLNLAGDACCSAFQMKALHSAKVELMIKLLGLTEWCASLVLPINLSVPVC